LGPSEESHKPVGHPYQVEGIGYDFIPKNCDQNVVDKWFKCNDRDSFRYARRLIREEGLLCGGSSGSVLSAAISIAKGLPKEKRIVIILADSIRNYMTKFLNDDWMLENEYMTQEEYDTKHLVGNKYYGEKRRIADLDLIKVHAVDIEWSVDDTLAEFEKHKVECVNVFNIASRVRKG
jgi:cystathionine beta-synthase